MNDEQKTLGYLLETLIDNHGISYVLNTIADICAEKAEHVWSNWQDKQLGDDFMSLAFDLYALNEKGIK